MEVPIVTTRSASSVVTDTRKVYVPYTEEAIKDNAAVVNNIKRARGSSNSFTEKNGYIYFVSTINFSRDYYQSSYDYPRIDLISFQITREVITSAPFNGFRNANATAYQLGTRGPGGSFSVLDQKKYYSSIPYGTLQYVPSSWEPVLTVGTTYNRGVSYSIPMVYTTHTENLTYFHQVI